MSDQRSKALSLEQWMAVAGTNGPQISTRALQPVRVEGGKLKLFCGMLNIRFEEGTHVGAELRGGRILLIERDDGPEVKKAGWWDEGPSVELELPPDVSAALRGGDYTLCLLVERVDGDDKELELLPVAVEEHDPDVFGPRIVDEYVGPDGDKVRRVVRHVVKGFPLDQWTPDRLTELASLVSGQPLAHDPLAQLAEGSDWIAWQTRNHILMTSADGDDSLRQRFETKVFASQREDGSWDGHVVKTSYGILHALSLDVPRDDERIQRAASWLLDCPEPDGRPGMWMLDEPRRQKWNERLAGNDDIEWLEFMVMKYTEADHDLFRTMEAQQEIPSCTRNHHAGCDAMMHPSSTAAMALCACGHVGHERVKAYANTMYQHSSMFGYFCSCWGILGKKTSDAPEPLDGYPDFNRRSDERQTALDALSYSHGRDTEDICALARLPRYPGIHRPDLSDTNGWAPYWSRDIGCDGFAGLDGAYWENADCWAKPNRALAAFPGWSDSVAEFFALFQVHLYQTPFGEWNQGYVSGIFRMIEAVTRQARSADTPQAESIVTFAKRTLLRTVPWLRNHQKPDGLWHFSELSRHTKDGRPPDPRLGTYHVVSVLNEFGLLDALRP